MKKYLLACFLIFSIDLLTCEGENTKVFPIEIPENINSSSKLPSTYVTSDENNLAVNKCRQELEMQKNPMQLCLGNKRSYHKRIEVIFCFYIINSFNPNCTVSDTCHTTRP